jgi:hypothetical protein
VFVTFMSEEPVEALHVPGTEISAILGWWEDKHVIGGRRHLA